MRHIFDEEERFDYELKVEAAISEAQAELGIIPNYAAKEIAKNINEGKVTLKRRKELEKRLKHETAALVEAISEACSKESRPWVHYGLTSNDVLDSATSLQLAHAIKITEQKLKRLTVLMAAKADRYRDLPSVGRTHGQHASIMPFGLKFAVWASDLLDHLSRLSQLRERVLVCKCLGPVGTGGVLGEQALHVQRLAAQKLNLKPVGAATQVVSRENYSEVVFECALIGATLDKIATELRTLQRTEIGEVMESFAEGQVGSSAIPVKRNPITSEKVSSLARLLRGLTQTSLENVALWDERDLSNSANERFTLPTSFIVLDEMLDSMINVVENLQVDEERIRENIQQTDGQIYSEFVLQLLIHRGVSRSDAHRWVEEAGREATNRREPFKRALLRHKQIRKHLQAKDLEATFDPSKHFGASKLIITRITKEVDSRCSTPTDSSRSRAESLAKG